jgi:uncharacterized membrane protein
MNYWPLAGILVVVLGFALRINALLTVSAAGIVTAALAGFGPLAILELFGEGLRKNRFLLLVFLTLPVVGVLERHGLREHAAGWIARMKGATLSRLLTAYLGLRQVSAAIGLTSLGGQAQSVRPLLAPMAEGALREAATDTRRHDARAMAAATDNVGLFFGEDVFVAFGAVLLMQAFYAEHGIPLEPLEIALWGIPTALAAFAIHAVRIRRFERRLGLGP